MPYCRWSSNNGYCDVYVYEDIQNGWVIYVANSRRSPGAPESGIHLLLGEGGQEKYRAAQEECRRWDEANPAQRIEHPEAGKSYRYGEPGDCALKLKQLKADGFLVPDDVIKCLEEEQEDLDKEGG